MIYILCMDSDSDVNVHKGVITSSAAVSNESEDGNADDINVQSLITFMKYLDASAAKTLVRG